MASHLALCLRWPARYVSVVSRYTYVAMCETLREMGIAKLKDMQREAVKTFLEGRDTFVILPTAYGKPLIYAVLPLVFDKLKRCVKLYFRTDVHT